MHLKSHVLKSLRNRGYIIIQVSTRTLCRQRQALHTPILTIFAVVKYSHSIIVVKHRIDPFTQHLYISIFTVFVYSKALWSSSIGLQYKLEQIITSRIAHREGVRSIQLPPHSCAIFQGILDTLAQAYVKHPHFAQRDAGTTVRLLQDSHDQGGSHPEHISVFALPPMSCLAPSRLPCNPFN